MSDSSGPKKLITKELKSCDLEKHVKKEVAINMFKQNKRTKIMRTKRALGQTWGEVVPIPCGLENSKTNTCYVNSVLQAISFTPALYNYLMYCGHQDLCVTKGFCVMCELINHMKKMTNGWPNICSPSGFIRNIRTISKIFKIPKQQDAVEFLTSIIEKAGESDKSFGTKFHSKMCNVITCRDCKIVKKTSEMCTSLLLNVNDKGKASIATALYNYIKPEIVSGYKCPKCKANVDIDKMYSFKTVADVLILQINRFRNSVSKQKNNIYVSYPDQLDLSPFMSSIGSSAVMYSLHAVIVHQGSSADSGHYFTYIKSPKGIWYCMNDTRVNEISEATVLTQNGAYILVYQKEFTESKIQQYSQRILEECNLLVPEQRETHKTNLKRHLDSRSDVDNSSHESSCKTKRMNKGERTSSYQFKVLKVK